MTTLLDLGDDSVLLPSSLLQEEKVEEEVEEADFQQDSHGHSHGHGSQSHSHGTSQSDSRRDKDGTRHPPEDTSQMLDKDHPNFSSYWRLLLSHFLTRSGDKSWEFLLPLILSFISPETILPPALFGFVTTGARVLLGTGIGNQVDKRNRLDVVHLGTLLQSISIAISSIAIWVLITEAARDCEASSSSTADPTECAALDSNIFATTRSTLMMLLLLASATLGSLSAMAMDISVERDWVPTIVSDSRALTLTNSRMRQVDLITEVGGPFIAGFLLAAGSKPAFIIIAGWNFVSFFPQYYLLRTVYFSNSRLEVKLQLPERQSVSDLESTSQLAHSEDVRKRGEEGEREEEEEGVGYIAGAPSSSFLFTLSSFLGGEWNPVANLYRSWNIFAQQPTRAVVISYALLWLTILSPHDPVFTASLGESGYTDWELGIFRGVGALFGIASVFVFPWTVSKVGLKTGSLIFIAEEGIALFLSGLMFNASTYASVTNPDIFRVFFMFFIVLSRCGLYGFEVGEIQILQQTVPEEVRGRVSSVEISLTSLASLVFYVGGMIFSKPSQFVILVWGSITFVNLGVILFLIWCCRWDLHIEEHSHLVDEEEDHQHRDPYHIHTQEQEQQMRERGGWHTHMHLHRRQERLGRCI